MKTKLFVLFVAALALTTSGYAQERTSFGIRGGVNFQNLNGEDGSGSDLDNKLKVGYNAGFNAEIPVGIDFYIQPGLLFSTKGAKVEGSDTKINLSYVELPVNFLYKPELGAGKLLLGFGPYFAMAVGGSIKPENGDDIDIEFKSEVSPDEFLTNPFVMKRRDAGANLLFGYEFANKLSVQLNAQLGLLNLNTEVTGVDNDAKVKNTGFGLSLGYRF